MENHLTIYVNKSLQKNLKVNTVNYTKQNIMYHTHKTEIRMVLRENIKSSYQIKLFVLMFGTRKLT